MGIIKPTLTLTANASSATTDAGPLSIALSLSVTDSLTVDTVTSEIVTLTDAVTLIKDGSALSGATRTPSTAASNGVGGYLYLKNAGTTKSAFIAIVSNCDDNAATATGTDTPLAPDASGQSAMDETTNITLRTMSLRPGEFAFFPWDYTGDLYAECEHSDGTTLEYFLFDRG